LRPEPDLRQQSPKLYNIFHNTTEEEQESRPPIETQREPRSQNRSRKNESERASKEPRKERGRRRKGEREGRRSPSPFRTHRMCSRWRGKPIPSLTSRYRQCVISLSVFFCNVVNILFFFLVFFFAQFCASVRLHIVVPPFYLKFNLIFSYLSSII
jgi:hypothetical protein